MKLFNQNKFIYFASALLITSLGHPIISPIFSVLSSCVGFALLGFFLTSLKLHKQKFIWGFGFFFMVSAAHLHWLICLKYHGFAIVIAYALINALWGIQGGVFSLLFSKKKLTVPYSLALSAIWTLIEWSRLYLFSGFAWNQVGQSLNYHYIPAQLAVIGGIYFLSFWVIFTNVLGLRWLLSRRKQNFYQWAIVALVPYVFGYMHLAINPLHKNTKHAKMSIAAIQTGWQIEEKSPLNAYYEAFIHPLLQWKNIVSFLSKKQTLDLIVLPESALPFGSEMCIYEYYDFLHMINQVLPSKQVEQALPILKAPYAKRQANGRWFISNGYIAQFISNYYSSEVVIGLDAVNSQINISYNAAFLFSPYQNMAQRYEKQKLIPLAEYMPINSLKAISAKYGITEFFTAGSSSKVFKGKYIIAPSICYDDCFANVMQKTSQFKPDILVNLTNDGWFPFTLLPNSHFLHSRLRAIELGLPLIRSTNNGITAVVNAEGKVLKALSAHQNKKYVQDCLFTTFSPHRKNTLYAIWGDNFIITLCISALLFSLLFDIQKKIALAQNAVH